MVTFARLAVSFVVGLLSLGGTAAESPYLKDIIDAIPDVRVKDEVKALINSRDMDGAEAKMIEYTLREADKLAPEDKSEKGELENNVVKVMKIIHDSFDDFKKPNLAVPAEEWTIKKDAAFEEEDVPEGTIDDKPEVTFDMMKQSVEYIEYDDLKERAQAAIAANDLDELELIFDEVIERMSKDRPDVADHAEESMAALHRGIEKEKKEKGINGDVTIQTSPPTLGVSEEIAFLDEEEEGEPEIDAKMMAEAIQKFPDDAAKETIMEALKANDFHKAEKDMLDAMDKMGYNDERLKAQVHKGMVNLKVAAEQYAMEKKEEMEEALAEELRKEMEEAVAKKKEEQLIETLETIKADQERIEELLKELDGKN